MVFVVLVLVLVSVVVFLVVSATSGVSLQSVVCFALLQSLVLTLFDLQS